MRRMRRPLHILVVAALGSVVLCGCSNGSTQATVNASCVPESDDTYCARLHKNCGSVAGQDNCGVSRTANCGSCGAGEACSSINICSKNGCNPESEEQLCMSKGWTCGVALSTFDSCGNARSGLTCGKGTDCGPNQGCDPKTHTCVSGTCTVTHDDFCKDKGAACGVVTDTDKCGTGRTENCGACSADQNCDSSHQCVDCETDSGFCSRLGFQCGSYTGVKNCGLSVTVNCGSCDPGACNVQTHQCETTCTHDSDAVLCQKAGKTCGTPTLADNCGTTRTPACGTCPGGQSCNAQFTCDCLPLTDSQVCAKVGKNCGSVTVPDDGCGNAKTIQSCGTCSTPQICSTATGTENVCCTPISDVALCASAGAQCGSVTATDNCGTARTIPSCGQCGGTQQCTNNACGTSICTFDSPQSKFNSCIFAP